MKITMIRITCLTVLLLLPITFTTTAMSLDQQTGQDRLPGLTARITSLDATIRSVQLEGVGCSVSICSRVLVKATTDQGSVVTTPLDTIAAITDISRDHALFVLKDGTQRRLSLIQDFRVLYVSGRNGKTE